jgi:hypothetical protein
VWKASRSSTRCWGLMSVMGIGFAVTMTLITSGSPQIPPPFLDVSPPPSKVRQRSRSRRCASLSVGCYGRP